MTYSDIRQRFFDRCAALLPDQLHSTYILEEISDAYPEIHTAEREYVCALDSHDVIVQKVTALSDDEIRHYLATYIADAIVAELEDYDDEPFQLTQRDADEIMTFVRLVDPTESNYAASVRDTIRDNFEHITV